MDNTDAIIKRLDSIDQKLDSIGSELNKSMVDNSVVKEKTSRNEDDIYEIKNSIIPTAILNGNLKIKYWLISGGVLLLFSVGTTIYKLIN